MRISRTGLWKLRQPVNFSGAPQSGSRSRVGAGSHAGMFLHASRRIPTTEDVHSLLAATSGHHGWGVSKFQMLSLASLSGTFGSAQDRLTNALVPTWAFLIPG